MNAPNHIAGGLFFSGFWSSFWNINIFQKPQYIAIAVVSSLLADIDHSHSMIGLPFYPLSSWIHQRYGHRTVTHSLLFLFVTTVIVLTVEKILAPRDWQGMTVIFFFGALSHLIIDMVTISGVPLLYPFKRNRCVIPGRVEFRMRSGKFSNEIVAFVLFCSMNFLCIDLYRQGFWFTYNNTFSTIEHVHYERANAGNFTLCRYHFVRQGIHYRGLAPIVDSKETSLDLFIDGRVQTLDYTTPGLVLKEVRPVKTAFPYTLKSKTFQNDSLSSINSFCRNRVVSGKIESNAAFTIYFIKAGGNGTQEIKTGTSCELANCTGVVFSIPPISFDEKEKLEKQIAIREQSLVQDKLNFQKVSGEYYSLLQRERRLRAALAEAIEISERNSIENELIRVKNRLQFAQVPAYTENSVTVETIRQLYLQLNQMDSVSQHFDGTLTYLVMPEGREEEVMEVRSEK